MKINTSPDEVHRHFLRNYEDVDVVSVPGPISDSPFDNKLTLVAFRRNGKFLSMSHNGFWEDDSEEMTDNTKFWIHNDSAFHIKSGAAVPVYNALVGVLTQANPDKKEEK